MPPQFLVLRFVLDCNNSIDPSHWYCIPALGLTYNMQQTVQTINKFHGYTVRNTVYDHIAHSTHNSQVIPCSHNTDNVCTTSMYSH